MDMLYVCLHMICTQILSKLQTIDTELDIHITLILFQPPRRPKKGFVIADLNKEPAAFNLSMSSLSLGRCKKSPPSVFSNPQSSRNSNPPFILPTLSCLEMVKEDIIENNHEDNIEKLLIAFTKSILREKNKKMYSVNYNHPGLEKSLYEQSTFIAQQLWNRWVPCSA